MSILWRRILLMATSNGKCVTTHIQHTNEKKQRNLKN